ncbi:hypothetical protein NDU88_000882 [Pleurodeles waltl]|uniref:Uncharacterized protein n=1 Tax=Pleurodeles waltl TaxID=8319 RepID=A0AAV7U4Z1_PLEWA|nr:hypothetical protein NDU88_000882 [Pleurodeles waltl]
MRTGAQWLRCPGKEIYCHVRLTVNHKPDKTGATLASSGDPGYCRVGGVRNQSSSDLEWPVTVRLRH